MADADSVKAKIEGLMTDINSAFSLPAPQTLTDAVNGAIGTYIILQSDMGQLQSNMGQLQSERDQLQLQLDSISSTFFQITDNGSYDPATYGYTYFNGVDVNVSQSLPSLETPAESQDVRNGKEYIDSSGNPQVGTMPEYGVNDININVGTSTVQIDILNEGYYTYGSKEVTLSSAGGNTRMVIDADSYSVGSSVFSSENLSEALIIWDFMFRQMTGSSSYYMPANVFLGELGMMINGAFIATAVDNSGGSTNSITFMGNSCDGSYSLLIPITATISESDGSFTQQITNIILTNNGETVDTSSGIEGGILAFIPIIG